MQATALTADAYRSYGELICAQDAAKATSANLGSAQRFNAVAALENLRPSAASANLCLFRCEPMVQAGVRAFAVTLLERHRFSTQAFIPMQNAGPFLVVVCRGEGSPDLTTLRGFLATGAEGITYRPGVWHHPLIAMEHRSDFACFVWEDGSTGDCDLFPLSAPITVAW